MYLFGAGVLSAASAVDQVGGAVWEQMAEDPSGPPSVPNQYLVRFKRVEEGEQRQAVKSLPGIAEARWLVTRSDRLIRQGRNRPTAFEAMAVVRLAPSVSVEETLAGLRRRFDVLYVEPDYWVEAFLPADQKVPTEIPPPNDFHWESLWGLENQGQTGGVPGVDIDARQAWAVTHGSRDIVVAVIDTGIDFFHPDLAENLWKNSVEIPGNGKDDDGNEYIDDIYGYDFVNRDADPMDDHVHGTHVAGTIGAIGDNERGVVGVAREVRLMALKALSERGTGSLSDVLESMAYAVDNGAHIINASWGLQVRSRALEDGLHAAIDAGVLFVAAAGNHRRETLSYPAAYPPVLAVAAINENNQRAPFSSFGSFVDLAAPGNQIWSTLPNNSYGVLRGTSMATPYVSGAAALVWARHPKFTQDQVGAILKNTTTPVDSKNWIGTGRLNAASALQVEVPLPMAELTLPETVQGLIPIAGTVAGEGLRDYRLFVGQGSNPTNWTEFAQGNDPVMEGTIVEAFDTAQLQEGIHTFRLVAEDSSGHSVSARTSVKVQNVQILYPLSNDILSGIQPVAVLGTVHGPGLSFTLEHSTLEGGSYTPWSTDRMELAEPAEGGSVIEDVLGYWRPPEDPEHPFHRLRLRAWRDGSMAGEHMVQMIHVEPRLSDNWPVHVPVQGEFRDEDWRELIEADLDSDGYSEFLLVDQGNIDGKAARLLVYRQDGTLWWERELGEGWPFADVPVAGDLDGDGLMEVYASAGEAGNLYGFKHDGRLLADPWPLQLPQANWGKLIADVNGDGIPELVISSEDIFQSNGNVTRQLRVYNQDGRPLRQWSFPGCGDVVDAPLRRSAVAQIDDTTGLEILVPTGCGALAAYHFDNPNAPLWTRSLAGQIVASPVAGDLDGDGFDEVVAGSYDGEGKPKGGLYVWNAAGDLLPGWPVVVGEAFLTPPALADLNNDQLVDVISVSRSNMVHAFDIKGHPLQGWPAGPFNELKMSSSPVVSDINGDHQKEVVIAASGHLTSIGSRNRLTKGGIKVLNSQGHELDLHPASALETLLIEGVGGGVWLKTSPALLGDFDSDGRLDIVASTVLGVAFSPEITEIQSKDRSSLYRWTLDTPFLNDPWSWPQAYGGHQQSGRFDRPPYINKPPQILPIPNQKIRTGESFFPIFLNRYVADEDHSFEELEWFVSGAEHLRIEIDDHGKATIEPLDSGWSGWDEVNFYASDPAGGFASTSVIFSASPDYTPPNVVNDALRIDEDGAAETDVLANDRGIDGRDLHLRQFSQGENGRVTLSENGLLTYFPFPNFHGTDSFFYLAADDEDRVAIGVVEVVVLPVPDEPRAEMDLAQMWEDETLQFDPLANDFDADGDPLILNDFDKPSHGELSRMEGSTLEYRPAPNYFGEESFAYRVADSTGLVTEGLVVITVRPVNDPPALPDREFTLNKNTKQFISFADRDLEGDMVSYQVVDSPENGEVWVFPNTMEYRPFQDYSGQDSFTVRANDGQLESRLATLAFTVLNTNNPPVAVPQTVVTKQGQAREITLEAKDPDKDPLAFEIIDPPSHGTLEGEGSNRMYHPNPDFLGEDSFAFRATDGESFGEKAKVTIDVTVANTPPVAKDQEVRTRMDIGISFLLQAYDREGDKLHFEILSQPKEGTLTGRTPNIRYQPREGFIGSDRFTYRATDGQEWSKEATVSLVVAPLNRRPRVKEQNVEVPSNTKVQIELDVIDEDGDELRSAILKGPQHGLLAGQGTTYIYSPNSGFFGKDRFTYKIWDGHIYSDTGFVTIQVSPKKPQSKPSFEAVQFAPKTGLQLRLRVQEGRPVEILYSEDLVEWKVLTRVDSPEPILEIIDPDTASAARRYYRAVQEE